MKVEISMNTKEQATKQIEEFLSSDEQCMLLTGTHYDKHKLVVRILNKCLKNKLILFRTNSMSNAVNDDFLGWAGVKKKIKAGERIKVGNNTYECDSINTSSTMSNTNRKFACAIVYPIDLLCRTLNLEPIDQLYKYKEVGKIFLVTDTDGIPTGLSGWNGYDFSLFSKYVSRHVIYDAEEEDPEYHKRVLENRQS